MFNSDGSLDDRSRADIQGLRAVAVLLVVMSHVGLEPLEGGFVGVDVFFVISGFLITGLLIKDGIRTGKPDFVRFYARRALRIVPAAAVVLVATDLAARWLLPAARAKTAIVDSIWAGLFGANVRFSDQGTDYFALDQPPSPFQHYWSLAVEEQFYLAWPVVLAILLLGLHTFGRPTLGWRPDARDRARVFVVLSALVAASLAWSVAQTDVSPTVAYFSSFTRAWELGVGALLALAAEPLKRLVRGWVSLCLGFIGIAAIAAAGLLYTNDTPFPGDAALLPVLGSAALLAAGIHREVGVSRLLGVPPLRYVGDISYSLYLWHWPILILVSGYVGHDLSVGQNLALMGAAFALAVVSYHLVENPFRRSETLVPDGLTTALVWSASTCVLILVGMSTSQSIDAEITAARASQVAPKLGDEHPAESPQRRTAAAQAPAFVVEAVAQARRGMPIPDSTSPPVEAASVDWDSLGACSAFERSVDEIKPCQIGDPAGQRSVVLFGDSHAEMWVPAFRQIAKSEHLRVYPFTKPGCGIAAQNLAIPECAEWYAWALDRIAEIAPDEVVMVHHGVTNGDEWAQGTVLAGREFAQMGAKVIVLGDSPVLPQPAPGCLQARGATLGSCAFPPNEQVAEINEAGRALPKRGFKFAPTSQWFCADALCPMVIGNVVVYVDTNHLTATYAALMADELASEMGRVPGSGVTQAH